MSRITLLVEPWGYPDVSRTIALSGTSSLLDLHNALVKTFELDDDHLHAFFLNEHPWDWEYGYYAVADGGQRTTAEARLDALALVENKRLLYLYDFGDEHRFSVRVARIAADEAGPGKPEIEASRGTLQLESADESADAEETAEQNAEVVTPPAPAWAALVDRVSEYVEQRERIAEMEGEHSLDDGQGGFDDDAFDDDEVEELPGEEGDDDDDDDDEPTTPQGSSEIERLLSDENVDLTPHELLEEAKLANELLDRVASDEKSLEHNVLAHVDGDVIEWLTTLPLQLAESGASNSALALAQRLLPFSFGELLRPGLPRLAALAGEPELAQRTIQENRREYPHDAEILLEAALTWQVLEQPSKTEASLREALKYVGSDLSLREEIVELLSEHLTETKRSTELRQLQSQEAAWRRRFSPPAVTDSRELGSTVRNVAVKIGRNDPCPCGSGKKYKKCCGVS